MNKTDLTYLLNKPETINEKQTIALESIVLQFPYFQAARSLLLKGLYNQDSFRYNYELKKRLPTQLIERFYLNLLPQKTLLQFNKIKLMLFRNRCWKLK